MADVSPPTDGLGMTAQITSYRSRRIPTKGQLEAYSGIPQQSEHVVAQTQFGDTLTLSDPAKTYLEALARNANRPDGVTVWNQSLESIIKLCNNSKFAQEYANKSLADIMNTIVEIHSHIEDAPPPNDQQPELLTDMISVAHDDKDVIKNIQKLAAARLQRAEKSNSPAKNIELQNIHIRIRGYIRSSLENAVKKTTIKGMWNHIKAQVIYIEDLEDQKDFTDLIEITNQAVPLFQREVQALHPESIRVYVGNYDNRTKQGASR